MSTISWFSAGVSSAMATRLSCPDRIIYIDIDDQHPDTYRFLADCQRAFGTEIETIKSPLGSVDRACRSAAYLVGPSGAACTKRLKRTVRKEWQENNPGRHTYVWGMDSGEKDRSDRIVESMPEYDHLFPCLDYTKDELHGAFAALGIRRPAMYELGYSNNNCIGCLKGGMGYWNKIRVDFPEIFAARAALERAIGRSCINGVFLDELDPKRGRHEMPVPEDCGIFCELLS
jgi:hypothetical protein